MRKTITGLAAAIAVMAVVPAMACGVGAYVSSCATGGVVAGEYYRETYSFERLPDPTPPRYDVGPRYYYVNQGPTYSGPGDYAPLPTYQERAVNGWHGYERGYYYGYNGGPYGDATSHYYDGMPRTRGAVVYRYPPRKKLYRYGSRQDAQPLIIQRN
jgi:hypothetical protein